MRTIFSLDAAAGLQRKHRQLVRDIDRIRSILGKESSTFGEDLSDKLFEPVTFFNERGERKRAFRLHRGALPFLLMGQARRYEILWMAEAVKFLG